MTKKLTPEDIESLTRFSHKLADAAAEITLAHFRQPIEVTNKRDDDAFDPVTEADKTAELAMRKLIMDEYADHSIIGEEFGDIKGSSKFTWVLDPIDGTRTYIMGVPTWGTLIALLYDGEPVIGVIDQPYIKERYIGTPAGSTLNGRSITCRPCEALESARLSTTAYESFSESETAVFDKLSERVKLNRGEFDCYAYAMVASGMIDIVAEAGMKIFDIMALVPIIRGAGGIASNWSGENSFVDGRLLTCGDARVHQAATKILGDAD